jgi:hypothetical protein
LDKYISNLRTFVDAFLTDSATKDSKIILMTPPPINCSPPQDPEEDIDTSKAHIRYITWVNKMRYADAVVKLGEEYVQKGMQDRVGCLDMWRALVDWALNMEGRRPLEGDEQVTECVVEERRLPGCGLPRAKKFPDGVFTDGLHFGGLVRFTTYRAANRDTNSHRDTKSLRLFSSTL